MKAAVVILLSLAPMIIVGFVQWSFNPSNWSVDARALYVFLAIVGVAISGAVLLEDKE
jgi:hypothetical protein